jgi:hypothetical protein
MESLLCLAVLQLNDYSFAKGIFEFTVSTAYKDAINKDRTEQGSYILRSCPRRIYMHNNPVGYSKIMRILALFNDTS